MYFKYKDINLYYKKIGSKPKNIIILPGWGNTRESFRYIIDFFKDNYTIYIVDYPGFGNSPIIDKELNIYNYSEIIKDFIISNHIDNSIIIAHSFGGRISSIILGKDKLKIKKLILIDVAGIKHFKLSLFIKTTIYKFIKKIINILPKKYRYKFYKKIFNKFSSNDYKSLPPNMHKTFQNITKENLKKYYKNINTDTLIIWGSKDKDTPLKDAYLLNKIIKKSKLIIYNEASHFSYLENINTINKNIKDFIEK